MAAKRFTVELERAHSHRREVVEWIDEAKRPETRARRIAAAVERARAGRPAR